MLQADSPMESLNNDLLENRILLYLDGIDIYKLSCTNKTLQARLWQFHQLVKEFQIHPTNIWPTLNLISAQEHTTISSKDLKNSASFGEEYISRFLELELQKWKFPAIKISNVTYAAVSNVIPKTEHLELVYLDSVDTNHFLKKPVNKIANYKVKLGYKDLENILQIAKENENLKELEMTTEEMNNKMILFKTNLADSCLTKLSLRACSIDDDMMLILYEGLRNSKVTFLDLSHNSIADEGTIALASILEHSSLETLLLTDNALRKDGIDALADAVPKSKLKYLDIQDNSFFRNDLSAFFMILSSTNLEEFHYKNSISLEEQQAFVIGLANSKLKKVTMGLANEVLNQFFKACPLSPLTDFTFASDIGNFGCKQIADNIEIITLQRISLFNSKITDFGIELLFAKLPLNKSIQELDISYNPINNFGVHLISKFLPQTNLKSLIMDACSADGGFVKLAASIQKSQLIKFKMRNAELGREGVQAFENLLTRTKLRWVDVSWGPRHVQKEIASKFPQIKIVE
ncbi:hypothetical protein HK103_007527 [Boothiomyces macroporosus]|uniref:RNI-like protein n=1 Tax=Boothiomyces macroporosus TaxID=261099 RepID=A0AAD5Y3X5_9FUNG|nr:hypothetical protein HK103_007527 [Boothiomyces macroporosus]